jgi:hypothetical protein
VRGPLLTLFCLHERPGSLQHPNDRGRAHAQRGQQWMLCGLGLWACQRRNSAILLQAAA